jgi:hypothetical protein
VNTGARLCVCVCVCVCVCMYVYIATNHKASSRNLYLLCTWIGMDSTVGKATLYRLDGPGSNPVWGEFSFSSTPADTAVSFTGVKWPERGTDHPPSRKKMSWDYTTFIRKYVVSLPFKDRPIPPHWRVFYGYLYSYFSGIKNNNILCLQEHQDLRTKLKSFRVNC